MQQPIVTRLRLHVGPTFAGPARQPLRLLSLVVCISVGQWNSTPQGYFRYFNSVGTKGLIPRRNPSPLSPNPQRWRRLRWRARCRRTSSDLRHAIEELQTTAGADGGRTVGRPRGPRRLGSIPPAPPRHPAAGPAVFIRAEAEAGAPRADALEAPVPDPEKAAARSRFGWAPPPRADDLPLLPPRATPYGATTPRAHRARAAASSEGGGSGQSTPTKSVSKPPPAYHAGMSGSRAMASGGGARVLGFPMMAQSRGTPVSFGQAAAVCSAEVVIRVRPLNNMEKNAHGYNRCLKQESAQRITWIGQPETLFTFDHVACEGVNQDVLFRVAGLPMVENCMAGYNSCVFAYGQTGSGKTYTMLGEISDLEVRPSSEHGMTPRIFEFLFARIRAEEESRRDEKLKYNCKCSFLEIYNEQITDLLDPSSTNLPLREDINGVYVENLTELEVGCVSDIIKLLMQGSMNRKVAATNMNSESSRSHSVFTCIIESRWEKESTTNLRFARLYLIWFCSWRYITNRYKCYDHIIISDCIYYILQESC
ncbi:hypothetical protein QYE76_035819 [Lolium multiflorum]|uniref:Kinesin motor domain-containing protein n=1 Tax=Lolium multiflorum TaxID=4521 RepID=A0AAD8R1M0_LOLMU|nr:hypothetical protein QYE76_035819 [Lolium multiflorum]